MQNITIGYIGQRRSVVNKQYLLGNGYRGFNPLLKRFTGQDSLSPFNAGGLHGYSYCGGDSTNQTDSNGRGAIIDLIMLVQVGAVRGTARALEADTMGKIVEDALADTAGVVSMWRNDSLRIHSPEGFSMTETEAIFTANLFIDNYVKASGYNITGGILEVDGITETTKLINVGGKMVSYYAKPRFNTLGQLYKLDIYTEEHVRLKPKIPVDFSVYMAKFEYKEQRRLQLLKEKRLKSMIRRHPLPHPFLPNDPDMYAQYDGLIKMLSVLDASITV